MRQYSPATLNHLLQDQDLTTADDTLFQVAQIAIASNNQRLIDQLGTRLSLNQLHESMYPFTEPGVVGKIHLGETREQTPVSLPAAAVTKHLLTVGQSGSGKTTLFYTLMDQLPCPWWAFDVKQDYRHLSQHDAELVVLPWTELKFNPLQPPPGVSIRRWAQVLSEIFGHATALLSGSKNYLLTKLIELYRLYGLFDDRAPPYPSLHELTTLIDADKLNYARKHSKYRDTVSNRLQPMTLVAGTIFDCSQGYCLEDLLKRNVVFELDGLTRDIQNFVMECMFAYVYEYRVAQTHRATGLNHVFVLDEGKQLFSVYKERQDAAGLPAIDELTAKMREFGEGLLVGDQEASKLTQSIKANTYTKVLLPTGDQTQFSSLADAMNLNEDQREYAQRLATGQAIVQIGNYEPVPVNLTDFELEKSVTDEELDARQAETWAELSSEPRERPAEFRDRVAPGRSDEVTEPAIIEEPKKIDLSSDADIFLTDIVENPFTPLTKRYQAFSSVYTGHQAKTELVDNGVVIERSVKTEASERKLLQLTKKGRNYAETALELDVKSEGRGGIVHQYWQHCITQFFEQLLY